MKPKKILKVVGCLISLTFLSACSFFSYNPSAPAPLILTEVALMEEYRLTESALAQITSMPTNTPSQDIIPRPPETISIDTPTHQQEINGGTLTITGYSEYFFESNLAVTLCSVNIGGHTPHHICGSESNIIAQSYATIDSPDIGLPGPYTGTIVYTIAQPTQAHLFVYATSLMDGAIEHLTSVLITLIP